MRCRLSFPTLCLWASLSSQPGQLRTILKTIHFLLSEVPSRGIHSKWCCDGELRLGNWPLSVPYFIFATVWEQWWLRHSAAYVDWRIFFFSSYWQVARGGPGKREASFNLGKPRNRHCAKYILWTSLFFGYTDFWSLFISCLVYFFASRQGISKKGSIPEDEQRGSLTML